MDLKWAAFLSPFFPLEILLSKFSLFSSLFFLGSCFHFFLFSPFLGRVCNFDSLCVPVSSWFLGLSSLLVFVELASIPFLLVVHV